MNWIKEIRIWNNSFNSIRFELILNKINDFY
jgi:hypothetical protein